MERKIDRFDKYMKINKLNDNLVTIKLALSIGTLGKSRHQNRDLSQKNIELILNYFPDLNRVWLITGEGQMLKGDNVENVGELVRLQRQVIELMAEIDRLKSELQKK